jgi:Ser/Thr protein kinase RdoA (MazF antagonist)
VSTFGATAHRWPPSPPAEYVEGLVSHNDLNLDNVLFRNGRAVALIDFDLAGPGSRLWDVACAARLWAPLRPDSAIHDDRRGRALERFRLFVDGYGVSGPDRPRVVEAVRLNHGWFRELIRNHAEEGHAVFAAHWNPEARQRAQQHARWFAENEQAMRAALGSARAGTTPEGR